MAQTNDKWHLVILKQPFDVLIVTDSFHSLANGICLS